jgi:hypothetical protein
MKDKNICDHTVAYSRGFILQSEITIAASQLCCRLNIHNEFQSIVSDDKTLKNDFKPVDLLDQRRGHMVIFNNCPYCGDKINWRKIKGLVAK